MKEFTASIIDPIGLHARPASVVSTIASKFKSDVQIVLDKTGKVGNLKSIMNVMSLGVKKGDVITIKINGADEEEAYKAIYDAFKSNEII
ncbi:HPr family phosphocarrier protein [Mycoplasmopsis fermentans]|uniref:Phosphocarrier protein HPr n=2 Tax=Mycoplasmopsis fermentans TaxID=2115 RepID=C4XDX3_MYCFP|nr:HPr family phosphocarrier protein [Mycoplasmopsis fermentans]VEU67222.1 phosphocarrier protein HPr [Mesomycoplasma conjunctivae]ADN69215.1 predicted phosphocarrier protein HPr [Mycoplasmopsis fermentans JER]ADV34747.1 Phosphocarrier protein HPr [Mycoplasmopsis fermentans M64]RMX34982.1 phosphocarrier protein HPr [Mycoplasmopsis fermentans MF-I1]RMX35087.1 phosphocarrier protein HPr [Mycoplasmopsis fermentans MF-I2]